MSHVLEGSARRSGDRIHLNAQLIDTRTDTHVWAEAYDRGLNDLFAIQAEIAQKVADHLHAKLSASEKASVEEKPTQDFVAYDFYVRGVSIIYNAQVDSLADLANLSEAVDLLNKAVTRDPNFFLAYCQLAFVHDLVYQEEKDHTPARLALAKSAIDSAFRLRPDSGEAHLALGWHLYWGYSDYARAHAELALAQQGLPNNPVVYELAGLIDRRQGRWADATHNLERACELDPRNIPNLITLATTYLWLHDYDQMARILDRIIALGPDRRIARLIRAHIEVDRRADTGPWRAATEKILTNEPGAEKDPVLVSWRLDLALCDRDLDAADLGLIDAALGRKQEALSEGRRAIELVPAAQEAMRGPSNNEGSTRTRFAMICAWAGERDLALEQLERLAGVPTGPSYGDLRLGPMWDPLRGEPRFEKIVSSLAPKE